MKILIAVVVFASLANPLLADELSPPDRDFLAKYEPIRAALAADDIAATRKAAAALSGEEGKKIAADDSLKAARADFATLSQHAVALAHGTPGYYVVRCPMVNKDWVQTAKEISNPYLGHEMLTCGVIMP